MFGSVQNFCYLFEIVATFSKLLVYFQNFWSVHFGWSPLGPVGFSAPPMEAWLAELRVAERAYRCVKLWGRLLIRLRSDWWVDRRLQALFDADTDSDSDH